MKVQAVNRRWGSLKKILCGETGESPAKETANWWPGEPVGKRALLRELARLNSKCLEQASALEALQTEKQVLLQNFNELQGEAVRLVDNKMKVQGNRELIQQSCSVLGEHRKRIEEGSGTGKLNENQN